MVGKKLVAIGGPLSVGVMGAHAGTSPPSRDLNAAFDEEDANAPCYLQYFGYNRQNGVPTGLQESQYGFVEPALAQPAGTYYGFFAESGLSLSFAFNYPLAYVYGTSGTAGVCKKVGCLFSYTDPNDPSITGTAYDDSEETPPPGETTPNANYYKFSVHAPASLNLCARETRRGRPYQ